MLSTVHKLKGRSEDRFLMGWEGQGGGGNVLNSKGVKNPVGSERRST